MTREYTTIQDLHALLLVPPLLHHTGRNIYIIPYIKHYIYLAIDSLCGDTALGSNTVSMPRLRHFSLHGGTEAREKLPELKLVCLWHRN